MRAVVMREFGGPEVLHVEEVPEPKPGPRDVLIRVRACGIDRHDLVVRAGIMKRKTRSYRHAFSKPESLTFPLILGAELAGDVVEVGSEVKTLQVGDRVVSTPRTRQCGGCLYCRTGREETCAEAEFIGHDVDGGYAEYVAVQWDSLVKVPEQVPYEEVCFACAGIGTSLRCVRDVGKVAAGDLVLITGPGGGLGVHAVQLARLSGGWVIAVTTSPDKESRLRELGAHEVIVVERGQDFSPEVARVTGGRGVDVAIDTVGPLVFDSVWRSMAAYGRMVLVGDLTGGSVSIRPSLVFLRRLQILSASSPTLKHMSDCVDLLARGMIRGIVADVLPLEEAARGHRRMEMESVFGRIVLKP